MKTFFSGVLFIAFGFVGQAQQDTALINRINGMLKLTQLKDIEKIMDYTYPKLFDLAPRELLVASMKEAYDTDEFIIDLDSIKVITIFPVFVINDTSYVKVKHTMLMKMKFKEPLDTSDMASTNFLVNLMGQKYGEENVRFDVTTNSLNIFMKPEMVGVKNKTSDVWTFANLNDDNPAMMEMLFSKAVLDKLKEYN